MVDQQWAVERLQQFVSKIEQMSELYRTIHTIGSDRFEADAIEREISELEDELCQLEPAVQIIMDAVDPELKDYQRFDPDHSVLAGGLSWTERWLPARRAALRAVGLHTVGLEAKRRMQVDSGRDSGASGIEGLEGADFELVWPRQLFVREGEALLAHAGQGFEQQCEWLLTEAFAGSAAVDALNTSGTFSEAWGTDLPDSRPRGPREFLSRLVQGADRLREASVRTPYWSQRRRAIAPSMIDMATVAREFVRIVGSFRTNGYFDREFPKICVDDHETVFVDGSDVLQQMLGIPNLHWPLRADQLLEIEDALFDVIEALHDLVARPRARYFHSYGGCGWHYSQFAIEPARALYRWRVNQLLDRSDLGLRLADEGEDVGRLVAVTDDARADLVSRLTSRPPDRITDRVRHGIALFRARAATEHDKRSAILTLAGILEERRQLLKDNLVKKDEGALFDIANNFALRHQDLKQQRDYDPAFLDWIFWWYLATVELSDHLLSRPTS
ncbi:hypothetical protein [Saccharothrix coeruleofusca]|uniref:Uncharacterized protein n=1 Tax=Saccharothrix coeruleofusca TaxID=33919 RepID=A0A918EH75_9PSEU|nr:hypothetical protein [Saccharothrix coeruleofusca]GGP87097.1 hypothetical protein GCM10010185_71050 [Saccharothrix coeruleofusca]